MGKSRYLLLCIVGLLAACSSIDCPFDSKVEMKCVFVGERTMLTDTLTVTALISDEVDSVLLNRAVDIDSFYLRLSYTLPADIFVLKFTDADKNVMFDTLTVEKENIPHFESVDCYPAYFHNITRVMCTSHYIEDVELGDAKVTYDNEKANIFIRLKAFGN